MPLPQALRGFFASNRSQVRKSHRGSSGRRRGTRLGCEQLEPRLMMTGRQGNFNGGFGDLAIGVPGDDVGNVENTGSVNVILGTNNRLRTSSATIWHLDNIFADDNGNPVFAASNDMFAAALAIGDFDADGFDDLAIGIPGWDRQLQTGLLEGIGAVAILYGQGDPVIPFNIARTQFFHQASPGVSGEAEEFDAFGAALAVGDFNGDGFDDLAVGVPGEDIGSIEDAGGVHVFYGSNLTGFNGKIGLRTTRQQFFSQDSSGIKGVAETGDRFGVSLAAGNFNGDVHPTNGLPLDDLVIGAPFEDVAEEDDGAVHVIYANKRGEGLSKNDQLWYQSYKGVNGFREEGDQFGWALIAGNFNGDATVGDPMQPLTVGNAIDDLAIGVPGENDTDGNGGGAGAVHVIYGSESTATKVNGLKAKNGVRTDQLFLQNSPASVKGVAEDDDRFGWALMSGNFNGDFHPTTGLPIDDLAIGAPGESVNGELNEGVFHTIYGTTGGLNPEGPPSGVLDDQLFAQSNIVTPQVNGEGATEVNDCFGYALSSGFFDSDGFMDLAIAAVGESIGTSGQAGAVIVIYGGPNGLDFDDPFNDFLHQDLLLLLFPANGGQPDGADPGDRFGGCDEVYQPCFE